MVRGNFRRNEIVNEARLLELI